RAIVVRRGRTGGRVGAVRAVAALPDGCVPEVGAARQVQVRVPARSAGAERVARVREDPYVLDVGLELVAEVPDRHVPILAGKRRPGAARAGVPHGGAGGGGVRLVVVLDVHHRG